MDIPAEHYNMVVEELDLSSRTLNCFKRGGFKKSWGSDGKAEGRAFEYKKLRREILH
ncbi:MAG: hypothetical protein CM1200mP3_18900 [Chloroflexota bacterium]|nr:MAG: hypothetical protein CM1200mP3_18900 [Chloroflexota bacterium]